MYVHTYSKTMDQPGKVASPARGQLNRENYIFLSAFGPENLVSRDGFGSPVPRQPAHSILRLNLVLTYGNAPEFRGGVHLFIYNRHTPSGQSRVYRVMQLRTYGVHCRESSGTGRVNLEVVPNDIPMAGVYYLVQNYLVQNRVYRRQMCIWFKTYDTDG